MRKLLHVGCGPQTLENLPAYFQDGTWEEFRLDIDPNARPDFVCSITDMSVVETGSFDCLYSSHNIEHVFPHEVPITLREFRRVLNPKGFAIILCPDVQEVARLIAEDRLMEPAYESKSGALISPIDILYGHRASIAQGQHYMAHRGGFTLRSLTAALEEAGFASSAGLRRRSGFELWTLSMATAKDPDDLRRLAGSILP